MRAGYDPAAIAAALRPLSPAYAPTPLLEAPRLAARLGVAQIVLKDESRRFLGSFKSLGGVYAGLRALERATGVPLDELTARRPPGLPTLLCASDGNHGLAVAAAAAFAGAPARVHLPDHVAASRIRRIQERGAAVAITPGTYDDAVAAARAAAEAGKGLLVPDTSDDPADRVVADVMDGYGVVAAEIAHALRERPPPTHLFVPAGVGGLAAALARALRPVMAPPALVVAVEPESAACLRPALAAGRPVRIDGDLRTVASLLSCGEASAPALTILLAAGARAIAVSEAELGAAPGLLLAGGGPPTTPSGAAAVAGLARALAEAAGPLELTAESRVLIPVTEGPG